MSMYLIFLWYFNLALRTDTRYVSSSSVSRTLLDTFLLPSELLEVTLRSDPSTSR